MFRLLQPDVNPEPMPSKVWPMPDIFGLVNCTLVRPIKFLFICQTRRECPSLLLLIFLATLLLLLLLLTSIHPHVKWKTTLEFKRLECILSRKPTRLAETITRPFKAYVMKMTSLLGPICWLELIKTRVEDDERFLWLWSGFYLFIHWLTYCRKISLLSFPVIYAGPNFLDAVEKCNYSRHPFDAWPDAISPQPEMASMKTRPTWSRCDPRKNRPSILFWTNLGGWVDLHYMHLNWHVGARDVALYQSVVHIPLCLDYFYGSILLQNIE